MVKRGRKGEAGAQWKEENRKAVRQSNGDGGRVGDREGFGVGSRVKTDRSLIAILQVQIFDDVIEAFHDNEQHEN